MNAVNYSNPKLKRIVNVYQEKYKNGAAQGLGDFLNGCFCLFQICIKFNIIFDIDIRNHPISKYFIQTTECNLEDVKCKDIIFFNVPFVIRIDKLKCYNALITYLNNVNAKTLGLFCNFDPFYQVHEVCRNFIYKKLRPTAEIENSIEKILDSFKLNPLEYEIIHIRTGDKYLLNWNVNMSNQEITTYKRFILQHTFLTKKYIIISDNHHLKKSLGLGNNFYIHIHNCEIRHTGENAKATDESLKNTVIDFFLMSYSSKITSISLKSRGGTGYSRACSMIFNKPYESLLIDLGFHDKF